MPYAAPTTQSDWIKLTFAAAELGCSPGTVKNMIKDGRLKVRVIRFDSFIRINRKDFERALAARVTAGLST
ncbi:helix-turn-helix domain-containing protein [Streptomyces sp. NPDC048209]|uniref:helix-turn-helix domain-containing protein n=1 Tax=Streptomyces TaxID=1883 RepID=UPI003420F3A8